MQRTDLFLFESAYGRTAFIAKIGRPATEPRGSQWCDPAEFEPVATDEQASDLLFIGELRLLKGVDVLIEAIAALTQDRPSGYRDHRRRRAQIALRSRRR